MIAVIQEEEKATLMLVFDGGLPDLAHEARPQNRFVVPEVSSCPKRLSIYEIAVSEVSAH